MKIQILEKCENEKIYPFIHKMLENADKEFIPPLSARSSATQQNLLNTERSANGIELYFEQLKKQRFIAAFEDDELIAFVSYKQDYVSDGLIDAPNIYISTLIVSQKARGKGVTKALYNVLFKEYEKVDIFTRTWSTNYAHIKILNSFDFKVLKVIENDRGNGIDTIYFKREKR